MQEARSYASASIERSRQRVAALELSLDGIILAANESFLQALGYAASDIRGKHHRMLLDPADVNSAYAAFWAQVRSGKTRTTAFRLLSRQGRPIKARCTFEPLLDRAGKPYKVRQYLAETISRAEAAQPNPLPVLPVSEPSTALAENLMVEMDVEGHITCANDSFCEILRYPADQIIGLPHRSLIFPDEAGLREYADLWERLRRGEAVSGRFRRRARDGSMVILQGCLTPVLNFEGKPFKILAYGKQIAAGPIRTPQMDLLQELRECVALLTQALEGGAGSDVPGSLKAKYVPAITSLQMGRLRAVLKEIISILREDVITEEQGRMLGMNTPSPPPPTEMGTYRQAGWTPEINWIGRNDNSRACDEFDRDQL